MVGKVPCGGVQGFVSRGEGLRKEEADEMRLQAGVSAREGRSSACSRAGKGSLQGCEG